MKRLFLFASVVATLFTACSSEKIEFKDANVKRICLQYWDSDADGELSYEEAAAVTDLSDAFINSEISVFNELQHFTGLTEIGDYAFAGCYSLTSITIPESVTEIGVEAFADCSSLTSITINNNFTSVGVEAFSDCYSLTDTYVNIKDLATYATGNNSHNFGSFYNQNNVHLLVNGKEITELVIPDGVTSIGESAFSDCRSLTSVTIPDSVTEICNDAFKGCPSLTSITIGNGVTSIGESAFLSCNSLTSVTIPESVTEIGEYAFAHCEQLASVTFNNNLTSVGFDAFLGCDSLTDVYVNIKEFASIGRQMPNIPGNKHLLMNGKEITELVISDSVTTIRYGALRGCSSLTSITIPNSVTEIGDYAFAGCSSLTSITIPNSVTEIGDWAFQNCTSLTSVTIPDSVTEIGDFAFWNCTGELIINSKVVEASYNPSVVRYGERPNAQNRWIKGAKFTKLTIGDSITQIGVYAFSDCSSLTSITIPESVTEIEGGAFRDCDSLESVYCKATTPPTGYYITGLKIYVPRNSVEAYKSAWIESASSIEGYDF